MTAGAACLLLGACTSDYGPYSIPSGYTYHREEYKAPPGPEPTYQNWDHFPDRNETAVAPIYTGDGGMAEPGAVEPPAPMESAPAPVSAPAAPVDAPVPLAAPDSPPAAKSCDDMSAAPSPAAMDMPSGVTVDNDMSGPAPAPMPVAQPADPADALWYAGAKDLVTRVFGKLGKPREAVYLEAGSGFRDSNMRYGRVLSDIVRQLGMATTDTPGGYTLRYSAGAPMPNGKTLLTLTLVSGHQIAAEEAGVYAVVPAGGSVAPSYSEAPPPGAPMPLMRDDN